MADTAARLMPIDVEAAFLLATPIAKLPPLTDGFCQLVAETDRDSQRLAGVNVTIDRGTVVECVARLDPVPRNRTHGDAGAWLHAMAFRDLSPLRVSGDQDLSHRLVTGVHDALFSLNGKGELPS